MRLEWKAASLLALSLALSGCGSGVNVKVAGKVLKGGQPYQVPAGQRLHLTLVAVDAQDEAGKSIKNEPFEATLDEASMTFRVEGKEGYGIPRGKYRVALSQRATREEVERLKGKPTPGKAPIDRETDFLLDRFSVDRSPIVREINGQGELVIDIDRPEAS